MLHIEEEQKKRYKVNKRPLFSLLIGLGFISVILLAAMMSAPKNSANLNSETKESLPTDLSGQEAEKRGTEILAVVKEVDTQNRKVSLLDVKSQSIAELSYTGGTNITDNYKKPTLMESIPVGAMVDAVYLESDKKLLQLNLSTRAWCYQGVSNLGINMNKNTMKIAKTLYKYENSISILDGEEFIPVKKLAEQDILTLWGYEETIWSIIVTKGHGVVILQDYQDFLGDYITIGHESVQQITDNLEITVREGNFNLTVENGSYSATKSVTVLRNKETYISLADLGPEASKVGRVTFEITPFGADLYLDNQHISYANTIELEYGEHNMKVAMGGYTSYQGTLIIDSSSKRVKIDLPENGTKDAVTITEDVEEDAAEAPAGNSGDLQTEDQAVVPSENNPTGEITDDLAAPTIPTSGEDIDEKHKLYVQNPTGASIYIDGEFQGVSPGNFPKRIGTHVITFIRDGYQTMSYTIEVADDGRDSYYTFPDLIKK